MIKQAWIIILLAAALTLSACSTVTAPGVTAPTKTEPPSNWKQQQTQLSSLRNWQINGKIGVITAQDAGTASVNWIQHQDAYNMSLSGPLGANQLALKGSPGFVEMTTPKGQHLTAATPEGLISKYWGWNLPVSNLKYWIRGMPVPGVPYDTRFDQSNRLATLTQSGWVVQYQDYTTVNGLVLPSRLSINSANVKTKIVINQWQLG